MKHQVYSKLMFVFLLFSFESYGFSFGDIVKDIGKVTEAIEKNIVNEVKNVAPGNFDKDLREKCSSFSSNEIALNYVSKVLKINELEYEYSNLEYYRVSLEDDRKASFDTQDFLLFKWIKEQLESIRNQNNRIQALISVMNYCAYEYRDNQNKAIFLSGGGGVDTLDSRLNMIKNEVNRNGGKVERSIDSNGQVVETGGVIEWDKIQVIRLTGGGNTNSTYTPVLPLAFFLDGDKVIESLAPSIFNTMDQRINELSGLISTTKNNKENEKRLANEQQQKVKRDKEAYIKQRGLATASEKRDFISDFRLACIRGGKMNAGQCDCSAKKIAKEDYPKEIFDLVSAGKAFSIPDFYTSDVTVAMMGAQLSCSM